MSNSYLQGLVIDKCQALGTEGAAEFFGVSGGLVKQWVKGSKTPSLASVELVFKQPDASLATGFAAEWADKEVFLALPFYKTVDPRTLYSILGIWDRAKYGASVKYGDAYIVHVRNQLAADFLRTGLPYCLWIDDDIVVPMGNGPWFNLQTNLNLPLEFASMHAPTRLRSHGKSIVGGLYFGRSPRGRAMYYEAMLDNEAGRKENKYAQSAPRNELRPCWWTGTGCLLHTRKVIEDIQVTFPHLAPEQKGELDVWHLFANSDDMLQKSFAEIKEKIDAATTLVREGNGQRAEVLLADITNQIHLAQKANKLHSALLQGEDQTFGKRAKVAGHQSYVDHGLVCGHKGDCIYGPKNTGQGIQ